MRRFVERSALIQIVFLSAMFYAAIPVIVSLGSPALKNTLPTLLPLLSGLLSLPVFLSAPLRRAVMQIMRSTRLLVFFLGNGITLVASLLFLALAIELSNAPTAILIVESWPLFTALILAPLLAGQVRKLNAGEAFWGAVAVLGVGLALKPEGAMTDLVRDNWLGVVMALISAMMMGAAVGFKAWCTRYLKHEHGINPLGGYFVMQLYYLPVTLLALPLLLMNLPDERPVSLAAIVTGWDAGLIALVVAVNIASGVLFSYATLRMRNASDTYLWFFAPAIAFGLYALFGPTNLRAEELLGLSFVVSANLISAIRKDTSLSFRALIVALLAIGTWCFLAPVNSGFAYYFEALGVLSIFFVILLSFALDWLQRQRETLQQHMIELRAMIAALPQPLRTQGEDYLTRMDHAEHPSLYRRAYHLMARMLAQHGAEDTAAKLGSAVAIRRHDLRIGYFVALGAILMASLVIGLGARSDGWVHDFFATIYLSAMVFVFCFLIESMAARNAPVYRRKPTLAGVPEIDLPPGRRLDVSSFWTLVLSLFLVTVFAILFIFY